MKAQMEWPSDVLTHVFAWTRQLVRPGLKRRLWKDVHRELRTKWVQLYFGAWCETVARQYNERGQIEEGGFESGHICALVDTVRAMTAVWQVPNAWEIDGLFLEFDEDEDEAERRRLLFPRIWPEYGDYEEYIVENAAWMLVCMEKVGVEARIDQLRIT